MNVCIMQNGKYTAEDYMQIIHKNLGMGEQMKI